MTTAALAPLTLTYRRDAMVMREPFRISGYLFEAMPAVIAAVSDGALTGRGEAAGVYYLNDDPAHMEAEIERCRDAIEAGISREALRAPPGGNRVRSASRLIPASIASRQRSISASI